MKNNFFVKSDSKALSLDMLYWYLPIIEDLIESQWF